MQLLIVHHDAEVGEQLGRMVSDYTPHHCDLVENDAAALRWAEEHTRCRLLLAQLDGPGINGLHLAGLFGEIFPGLQTLFLPAYAAAEQRFKIAETKVFPEPIDGERLLAAIEAATALNAIPADLFDVTDVLQMCCLSRRSGAVQMVKLAETGVVFLGNGRIVHAETAAASGLGALREIVGWGLVEFAYDPYLTARETISAPWDEALSDSVGSDGKKDRDIPQSKLDQSEKREAPVRPARRGFFGALKRN